MSERGTEQNSEGREERTLLGLELGWACLFGWPPLEGFLCVEAARPMLLRLPLLAAARPCSAFFQPHTQPKGGVAGGALGCEVGLGVWGIAGGLVAGWAGGLRGDGWAGWWHLERWGRARLGSIE